MRPSSRLTLAASLTLAPLAPLSLRLVQLQILSHRSLSGRASEEFARIAEEAVPRADIVDRKGRILARSVPTWSCYLDRKLVRDPQALARELAPLLGLPVREIARKAAGRGRFAWLKTGLGAEEAAALAKSKPESLGLVAEQTRAYPGGDLARGVLGLVGREGRGLAGLELTLEKRLRGKPRRLELVRDGRGRALHREVAEDGSLPAPVRLTLDRTVQYLAEEALRDGAAAHSFKSGLAAVQDPRDGRILALASWPPTPLHNPLVQDPFEPGSTYKVVTALAALEDRLVSPSETFSGEGGKWAVAPGVVISDHEPEGEMTLRQILERSSNIGIAKVVERVGPARFHRMSRSLGFGAKTGVPLPGEASGELKPFSDLGKVGLAASSYGYGLLVSPLQVLGAYSALANGGTLWEPRLLEEQGPPARVRRVASEAAVAEIARALEGVVDAGTAAAARIPGYRVAGKTGTARKVDPLTKRYSTNAYAASFVGWLPASAPRWTILVVLHEPRGSYYGGQVAAPIFARIGARLLALEGIPPDRPGDALLAAARR